MAPSRGQGGQKYKKRMEMSTATSFCLYCSCAPKWMRESAIKGDLDESCDTSEMAIRLRTLVIRVFLKDAIAGHNAPKVTVPNGVVLLHQSPISDRVANISSFAVSLETYLRMANIPYKNSFVPKNSPKGKIPWIEYNGKKIADSNFCVSFLNEEFKVTLDDKLSKSEKAVSHAIKTMVKENTYW